MSSCEDERLKRVRFELQSAYTLLERVESPNTLTDEKLLDLWRARARLELAILLIKLSSGIDYENRRARCTAEGGSNPKKILAKTRELIADALNSPLTNNDYELLEKVRLARDLLWLVESKSR